MNINRVSILGLQFLAANVYSDSLVDRPLADIAKIDVAVNTYYLEYQKFPETLEELAQYKELPIKDPWGVDYIYEKSKQGRPKIYTLGEDHKVGGVGENKDRGSWEISR